MKCRLCNLESGGADFCCTGCQNVYAILMESGVLASGQNFRDTALFQESLRLGLISRREQAAEAIPDDAPTCDRVFQVSGMWCGSCGWLIEHALGQVRGVKSASVLFTSDLLKVRYAPQYLPPERIVECVQRLGYRAAEYTGESGARDKERQNLLLRTGIAAFLSANAMMFSLVVYASYFERITGFGRYIPFVLMALATPSVLYCAAPVLRLAWAGLRVGILRMETLLSLGILAAYGYSVQQAFAGSTHVYFDTVCAIVTLVLTGKVIERGAKEKAIRAITLLQRLMPNKARLVVDGHERFVSLEALKPGAVFLVKPGERIPADGTVLTGQSHADESVLTGESKPRAKAPGDPVVCGSLNIGGVLEVKATRVGAESSLAHIARTAEQAAAHRTNVERSVDRASRLFIPAVLVAAVATFVAWQLATARPAEALLHAIAVLVIACPCALGIATPLALTASVAAASRRGVLVSDSRILETIRNVDVVVLDKTGTATVGEFSLLSAEGDTTRLAELAAVEACSEHPVGKALVKHVGGSPRLRATAVSVETGLGITGTVAGVEYRLGSWRMFDGVPAGSEGTWFGWDGQVKGRLLFGDRARPDARDLCAELRRRRVRTLLLSGDSRAATERTAQEIGADDWRAEATPDQKVDTIAGLQQSGLVVAMIGDGVNDAPSLAQADLGIALGSGTDIAMHAAPLVLMRNSLSAVTETLDLARKTFRVVRQNLVWAFAYNVAGMTLAAAGILNPILAAAAMVLSSVSVIGNSRRLD